MRRPEIHLFAARSLENSGDTPGARAAYQLVHAEISPGLLEAIVKHVNMERRLGNVEDACSLYEQAIAIEKGKNIPRPCPCCLLNTLDLFIWYALFVPIRTLVPCSSHSC
ncbi:hypothetical protein POM88_021106 [Heracleum sosnowskyi]|uniref:Uncharacterized protein n=1 Tax=Heracleum sosnowskyi TaxID=360622 RepID=A0AAD8MS26_9APIA|nr:hypothetical protein POM88_021106 [Heracleum sosnowskyi]